MDDRDNEIKKATNAEVEQRIATILEMIIKGISRGQIIRYASENWHIGSRQTETYLARAYDDLKAGVEKEKEKAIAVALARYNDLFSKNYKIQDYRECRQVQDSLNKMLGLNEAEKQEITVQKPLIIDWSGNYNNTNAQTEGSGSDCPK